MDPYTEDKAVARLALLLVSYASTEAILFVIASLLFRIPVDYAMLAVVLGSFIVPILSVWVLYEILTGDEKSDNTEDKGSADEKPEEYKEDETDLSESLFPDLK